jgi:hypothetical protein
MKQEVLFMLILIEGVPDVYCPLDVEGAVEVFHTTSIFLI